MKTYGLALIITLVVLPILIAALHVWRKKILQNIPASDIPSYVRNQPGPLAVAAMMGAYCAVGLALHAAPRRWPEWLRTVIAAVAFAALYWGGSWILRRLGRGPS